MKEHKIYLPGNNASITLIFLVVLIFINFSIFLFYSQPCYTKDSNLGSKTSKSLTLIKYFRFPLPHGQSCLLFRSRYLIWLPKKNNSTAYRVVLYAAFKAKPSYFFGLRTRQPKKLGRSVDKIKIILFDF